MKKLSKEFWDSVNPAFACLNELVVLPESGDCGFIEYFDEKAATVLSRKKIYSAIDSQSKLMLEYPEHDCPDPNAFKRFFESPSVVAQNQIFEGLFAVDISNYVSNLNHDRFSELLSYIKANPQIVFILFFYSDNEKEIERVHTTLLHHMDFVKTLLPEPSSTQLLTYTLDGMAKLCGALEDGIEHFLSEFYAKNKVGYDSADYLLRHLKLSAFRGTLQEVQSLMAVLNVPTATGDRYTGIGF